MTLLELLDLYALKRLKSSSPNTLRLYHHTIRSFAKTLGTTPTVANLNDDDLERHMWQIVKRGGSPASANKDRSQIIALWNFAFGRRIVEHQPNVRPMKEPEQVPLGWLPDELDRLFSAARRETQSIGDVPGNVWFTALFRVLVDTGERIGAIRQLSRSSLHGSHLLVPAAVRKGKTRDRLFLLNPNTLDALETLLSFHDEPLLFAWPYSQSYFYNRYNNVLLRAGLEIGRRNGPHRWRRTVASAIARAGGDPTAALDHASPKTTKKYLDPRIVGGMQVCEVLANYLADPTLRQNSRVQRRKSG